ncbi:alpha/beta hydrolase family protein [Herbiconiux solani]|uniref:alpha/beta hydrolase family protein n=1 Tax=Herbiconiux solani TaxID=661329 RepID=UPI0008268660|nr:alpha/beta hydrolase [Herbiconiux solani]
MIVNPPGAPRGILLFGPGAGGDPARYDGLITAAAAAGFIVSAPLHERFDGRTVTDEQMRERAVGLAEALREVDRLDADRHGTDHHDRDRHRVDRQGLPVVAAGHSVGGWAALCLAGARPWSRAGQPIPVPVEPRITKVVALAPTVGWFAAPNALDELRVPVVVLTGAADAVTPPATAELLRAAPAEVSVHTYPGVGHLDFLTTLPPSVTPTPGLDHGAFVEELAADFVAALTVQ